ncbi:MAG: TonB-dependent receptor [Saprospiraceae bacterium]|nr:TonB-dependent receptor [Saprospiraceae bacterium]
MKGLKCLFALLFLIIYSTMTGQTTISGKVTNSNGEKIEFASVFLINTQYAAISDYNGQYEISDVIPGKYDLKVTYLGYEPTIIPVEVLETGLNIDLVLNGSIYRLDEIEILANRVADQDAFTYKQVDEEELAEFNNGQDMPYALRFTPSAVVTSDAGTGIGYTGLRIRGSDATRVNVTINGVPLNDAESQGVFWVNLPDFLSSTESIQVQRGVGSSTPGGGAFGGSISLSTMGASVNPYASVITGIGDFNSKRLSVKLGSGLIGDHYNVDARYSRIQSDGYIDRASADLNSFYLSASRISENNSLRLMVFSGHEVTYQSWWGAPEAKVKGDASGLLTHYYNNLGSIYQNSADSLNLFVGDRRYNYYLYENQVDDYGQTHVQLHSNNRLSDKVLLNGSLFYVRGKGFFEEFKIQEDLIDYGLSDPSTADLVRRRWLDNHYYGLSFNGTYEISDDTKLLWGGHASRYDGDHYGRLVEVSAPIEIDKGRNYYFNKGDKAEHSLFMKYTSSLTDKLSLMADAQYRNVNYEVAGDDNDGVTLEVDDGLSFFNPKLGLYYQWDPTQHTYASYAVANKEPNRSDYVDSPVAAFPRPERLYDLELGHRIEKSGWGAEITAYHMRYTDQLILTGALNDVGSPLRSNVDKSHRMGIELNVGSQITKRLSLAANATFSTNKISEFTELIYDYTTGFDVREIIHEDTDIAFSPNQMMGLQLDYIINRWVDFEYRYKFVGEQFLDNTSNPNRALEAYGVHDLLINVSPVIPKINNTRITIEVRNLLNGLYSSNGYTYSYIFGDLITENFLYPQAERNVMVTLRLNL